MEFRFFRHNNCCLHWIESPRTARIVRGWTRRATNPGRTARAVAPPTPNDWPPLHRSSNRPRFEYRRGETSWALESSLAADAAASRAKQLHERPQITGAVARQILDGHSFCKQRHNAPLAITERLYRALR